MPTPVLPKLNIPASSSTVSVSIINTSGTLRGVRTRRFLEPEVPGHDWLAAPCYSFLIQHRELDRTLVFDLGMRKDWWNWPPPLADRLRTSGHTPNVPRDVREILDADGEVDAAKIEAVIWSHWHFDHTGDPSTFDPSTALIVGPGCKEHVFPGWPANPRAAFNEADYAGREVRELDFSGPQGLKIGRFDAIDYFGDGSFYLLDSPGHAVGHVCGLARVKSSSAAGTGTGTGVGVGVGAADPDTDDSFILMGGDAVHHGGELRPHPWHPLPEEISPHPFDPVSTTPCPGELFECLLRDAPADPISDGSVDRTTTTSSRKDRQSPIYTPQHDPAHGAVPHHDIPQMAESIRKVQEADAHDNIFVVAAHDQSLLGIVDFFPATADEFREKGWVRKARWAFLMDFAKGIGFGGGGGEIGEERMARLEEKRGDFSALSKEENENIWSEKGRPRATA